ncbi:MAG: GNAT family N-acetyltransferase [Chloroflexi bacterium]|nr:GNAT family N-acetyltransferase [Chloroflexota bacterium]
MNFQIRPFIDEDLDDILQLSLLAWQPVYSSFAQILGSQIYPLIYPDWRQREKGGISAICQDKAQYNVLIAEVEGEVVGFLAYELHKQGATGIIQKLAVHPDYQNDGIGTELNITALQEMKAADMKKAEVGTGGDESHAPARRAYEKAGFTALPLVRYYKAL